MAVEQGLRTSGKEVNLIRPQEDDILHALPGNAFAFVKLMNMLAKVKVVGDMEFKLTEINRRDDQVQINANALSTDTVLTLLSADQVNQLRVGDTLRANTGEYMTVTAITPSGPTMTVTRGTFGTTAAALTAGDYLVQMTGVRETGMPTGRGTSVSETTSKRTNYLTLVEIPVELTNDAAAAETHFSNFRSPREFRRFQGTLNFWTAAENIMLFSKALKAAPGSAENLTGTTDKFYTGGAFHWIEGTANDQSGAFSVSALIDWLQVVNLRQTNPESLFLFAGPSTFSKLSTSSLSDLRIAPGTTTAGLNIDTLISPHGTFKLIRHPMFIKANDKKILAVQMRNVAKVIHKDQGLVPKFAFKQDVADKDTELSADQYIGYFGFDLALPSTHGIFTWS